MKGHHARAAEKFAFAAEEAERVYVFCGSPDCIFIAALRSMQVTALLDYSNASTALPADKRNTFRKAVKVLPGIMNLLQRLNAAGTLLPGPCQAAEVAWFAAYTRHSLMLNGKQWANADAVLAQRAPYAGLETFMRVASSAAFVLERTLELSDIATAVAFVRRFFMLFLTSALELMVLPRPGYEAWIAGEPELVRCIRKMSPLLLSGTQADEDGASEQLHTAWRRVLNSGVLRTRQIDDVIKETKQLDRSFRAAAEAALEAGKLRACGLASCAAREAHEAQYKLCAACRAVCYCCREHQLADWPAHKAACKGAMRSV